MTVDPRSDRPIYRQIADILRTQISDGTLQPGQMLPSEKQLADSYGVGRDAVRQAISVLRAEALLRTTKGQRSAVRVQTAREEIVLPVGGRVSARMSTDAERQQFGLDESAPVLVVDLPSGERQVYPAERVLLTSRATPAEL